jgi:hypothetical protein
MKILHLTLNKKWFDMILSGDKKEEYREIKPYWRKRLMMTSPAYTHVKFTNGGYGKNRPSFIVELQFISTGYGRESWGAQDGICYYCLRLGEIIKNPTKSSPGASETSDQVQRLVKWFL